MIFTITMHDSFGTRLKCNTPNMTVADHVDLLLYAFPPVDGKVGINVIPPAYRLPGGVETIYIPNTAAENPSFHNR